MVREGKDLKSTAAAERLSTAAVVEELDLVGDRLNYKLVTGTGPKTGWVSLKIKAATLLVKKEAEPEGVQGPGDGKDVDVEALRKKIEAAAKVKQSEGALKLCCMKYEKLGYPLAEPKLRVLCFHAAGSAESLYTSPGTGLVNWAKEAKNIEVCAFDYPGRDKLLKHEKISVTTKLAEDLLATIYEKMTDGVPYMVWGHSVGTWVAFEFLMLARMIGLPMPVAAFFAAFPAPHMPEGRRTWHRNKDLNDKQMQEELRNWDKEHFDGMGKVVFDPTEWGRTWEPLMRSDFCLFDQYRFGHTGAPKFSFPIHAMHFEKEHYNTADQVEMWRDWTDGPFDFQIMKGMGHLTCVYKPDQKKEYFAKVTDHMKKYFAGL